LFLCCSLSTQAARRPKIMEEVASNTITCDICQVLVTKIEEALKDQQTEEEIARMISQYCTIFGEKVKPLCESIANQYIPIILQFLENKMEKLEICQKIGFCEEASVSMMPSYIALNNGGCDMCTTIVTKIEELLKNGAIESEIAAAISLLCKNFPFPVSTLCGVIVNRYVPTIIKWIESGVEKADICAKLGFCEKTLRIAPDNGISCTMCKTVVGQVEHLLLDQKVESEIIEALQKLCKKFPEPYDSLCENFVQKYTVEVMSLIEQGIEKAEICKKFGYCAQHINVMPQANPMGCTVCSTIISEVEKIMVSTKVESEVIALVKKLCVKFPAPYAALCDSLCDEYIPQIMEWLQQGLERIEICKKLGFCPKEASIARFQNGEDGMACTICTSIVAEVEKVMEDTKIESEVADIVKKLCTKFPAPYSTLCDSLISEFIPQIMKWLEQGLEHIEICQKMKLCPVTKLARFQNGEDGMACTICTSIVAEVEKVMEDTKIESEVADIVKKLCTKFPAPYSTLCDSLISEFIPQIMKWLEQGLEHIEICQKMKLCPVSKLARFQNDAMACTICEQVVGQIEKIMTSTQVQDEVVRLAKNLCGKLPEKYSLLCKLLVEENIPQIMDFIEQKLEKVEICKKFKLCPQEQKTFLGARIPTEIQNGVTCDVCKDFFKWASKELETVSIDTLWFLVNSECPKVPYLKYFCQVINEQNIETLVNLLLSKIPFDKACEFIKIC